MCAVVVNAQETSSKKSKQEKKIERYYKDRQAILDTSFFFQTLKITSPYLSANSTGGYLRINGNTLRIQEIDWVGRGNKKVRWRDQVELNNYHVFENDNEHYLEVRFGCQFKANQLFFIMKRPLNGPSELTIRMEKGKYVQYEGKLKV